jgi:HEPN domain-containing protein
MKPDRFATASIWLGNAEDDLKLAAEISTRYPARACFHAQQASEMALNAALIARAGDGKRTHIADDLLGELRRLAEDVPAEVSEGANRLDLFYMSSRYPDALGGADPRKVLQRRDAQGAIGDARLVYEFAARLVERMRQEGEETAG